MAAATVVAGALGVPLRLSARLVAFAAGSTVLHTTDAGLTQEAYRRFDLSQIYPLLEARTQ